MADRGNSTPPEWRELSPFRSVFTRHLPDEATRDAFQRLGSFLFAATLEATTTTTPDHSEVTADLRAIGRDPGWMAEFLCRVVAGAVDAFELAPEDMALAKRAGAWSARVKAIAGEISGALEP